MDHETTHTVTVEEALIDIRREARTRGRRLLKWVELKSLTESDARTQIARLNAAVAILEDLHRLGPQSALNAPRKVTVTLT